MGPKIGYATPMASEHMIQAIGTLERAISRLERQVTAIVESPAPTAISPPSSPVDASAARAALKSLDALITELKGKTGG